MNICQYDLIPYRGKSLMEWAILWFKTSNDAFYNLYGFNFNPHRYPYLYELARERVYPDEKFDTWEQIWR